MVTAYLQGKRAHFGVATDWWDGGQLLTQVEYGLF